MFDIRKHAGELWRLAHTRHAEWIPLAALVVVALAGWAFVELADEVTEGDLQPLDRSILLAMRHPEDLNDPLGPRWIEELMRDLTALGSLGVLAGITACACGYLWLLGKRTAMLYVLVSILGAAVLSITLKWGYDRPRPNLVPHGMHVYTASFPSGHSVMSAATFLTLAALLARYQPNWRLRLYLIAVALAVTLAVGISRVYLSVHWPTDVVAGWTIGGAWALLCWAIAAWLQKRGVIERQPA